MPGPLHVVCAHCDAVNRVPAEKLAAGGRCGSCHRRLFEATPVALNEVRFDRHIARSDVPLLVDFWAPWCGPCRAMAPVFAKAASVLEPQIRLAKLNTDEAPSVSARLQITSIPTLILFAGGKARARIAGALPLQELVDWTRRAVAQEA